MTKKYFWLKLKDDFFDKKEIKRLRKIAGGDTYTIIYLKLLLLSLKEEGNLFFDGIGDDFVDELALDIDEKLDDVKITITYLQSKGLLEVVSDNEYHLNELPHLVGSETESAQKMRRHRLKTNKALEEKSHSDHSVTNSDTEIDIEIEKELKKEELQNKSVVHQDELFEEWWNFYNKKVGDKKKCRTRYKSFLNARGKNKVTHEEIMEGTRRYQQNLKDLKARGEFAPTVKYPYTFLNGENFKDEYEEPKPKPKEGRTYVNPKPFRPDSVDLGDEA